MATRRRALPLWEALSIGLGCDVRPVRGAPSVLPGRTGRDS